MRVPRSTFAVFAAAVVLTACSGGGSRVLSGNPAPVLTTASPTVSTTPAKASPTATHTRVRRTAGPTATRTAAAPVRSTTTVASRTPTPTPTRTATATATRTVTPTKTATAPCAGVTGTTTTIRETAGYRFTPDTLSIHKCDTVKAVYADTTGAAHTWQGPGWNSGNMSGTSNSTFAYRFTSTGTFNFYCAYHQSLGMVGSVTVR